VEQLQANELSLPIARIVVVQAMQVVVFPDTTAAEDELHSQIAVASLHTKEAIEQVQVEVL
jgi:hypothetical protein